jgi:hypothetical protein
MTKLNFCLLQAKGLKGKQGLILALTFPVMVVDVLYRPLKDT